MTNHEILNNLRSVDRAIAEQSLEGLIVPQETVDDLQRVARGEMTTSDALKAALARYS